MKYPSSQFSLFGMLTTESPLRDLEAIIRSRTPLIAVESNEEPQIVNMVRQISERLQLRPFPMDGHGRLAGVRSERSAVALDSQIAGASQLHQGRREELPVRAAGFSSVSQGRRSRAAVER